MSRGRSGHRAQPKIRRRNQGQMCFAVRMDAKGKAFFH